MPWSVILMFKVWDLTGMRVFFNDFIQFLRQLEQKRPQNSRRLKHMPLAPHQVIYFRSQSKRKLYSTCTHTCQVSHFEHENHASRHQITLSWSPPLFSFRRPFWVIFLQDCLLPPQLNVHHPWVFFLNQLWGKRRKDPKNRTLASVSHNIWSWTEMLKN
jgi:hypothetical protein